MTTLPFAEISPVTIIFFPIVRFPFIDVSFWAVTVPVNVGVDNGAYVEAPDALVKYVPSADRTVKNVLSVYVFVTNSLGNVGVIVLVGKKFL